MHSKLQGNQTPLLSIIAPIRNEREYIFELIASFSKINDQRVELLISDNHSDDGSYEAIKNTEFENIKIVKPKYRLSPFDNHIFALSFQKIHYQLSSHQQVRSLLNLKTLLPTRYIQQLGKVHLLIQVP